MEFNAPYHSELCVAQNSCDLLLSQNDQNSEAGTNKLIWLNSNILLIS